MLDKPFRSMLLGFLAGMVVIAAGLILDWSDGAMGSGIVLGTFAAVLLDDVVRNGWRLNRENPPRGRLAGPATKP